MASDVEIGDINDHQPPTATKVQFPEEMCQVRSGEPQDVTQSFRENNDTLKHKRLFQRTVHLTFRPVGVRSSRRQTVLYVPTNKWMVGNHSVSRFFRWTFRSSFFLLIIAAQLSFFMWTAMFALLHSWNVLSQPDCVSPAYNSTDWGSFKDLFRDCWQLSWTTFATVGYGVIAPSMVGSSVFSNNHTAPEAVRLFKMDTYCFAQSFLCSIEALTGILFAGFWTAVLFSKVAKVNNKARVIFSSPMIVQYGSALNDLRQDNKTYPCPVLEFRIVNKQDSQKGGSIINASVNVVASLRKEQLKERVRQKSSLRNVASILFSGTRKKSLTMSALLNHKSVHETHRTSPMQDIHRTLSSPSITAKSLSIISSDSVPEMDVPSSSPPSSPNPMGTHEHNASQSRSAGAAFVFTPLTVEPGTFPLFTNVITIRHLLNDKSPLLKPGIRSRIKRFQGSWPEDLCVNPESVKNCIRFEKILVSFSGISQLNASSVYAQKIYTNDNLFVGKQFEDLMVMKPFGSIVMDISMVSEIRDQWRSKYARSGSSLTNKIHEE